MISTTCVQQQAREDPRVDGVHSRNCGSTNAVVSPAASRMPMDSRPIHQEASLQLDWATPQPQNSSTMLMVSITFNVTFATGAETAQVVAAAGA